MTWTYDPTTTTGMIRLLIPDRIEDEALFSDEELAAFATLEGGSARRAAATAIEAIATDEALVQKAIRLLDLTTNGPATAQALLARAKMLREQAETDEAELDGGFDIASWAFEPFGVQEIWANRRLRDG